MRKCTECGDLFDTHDDYELHDCRPMLTTPHPCVPELPPHAAEDCATMCQAELERTIDQDAREV